ncbi:MAG: glycoside hydrolase family 88 protein [Salinibacterium sp.]|nr:glycoside hydrolase family 88 protein [Salinibacterium sp.]
MSTTSSGAWGQSGYDAEADADAWLHTSPRSGAPAMSVLDREFAVRIADGLVQLPFATWNFGDSVAFDALVETTEHTGDERWATFVRAWGRSWATRARPFARLDCTAPGPALVRVAPPYGDATLLAALTDLADYLRARPLLLGAYETWKSTPLLAPYGSPAMSPADHAWLADPPACICVDCLHFDPPFFVRLGVATDDDELVADGVGQALAYIDALQTPSGLFDHFRLAGSDLSFGPGWGRGQGWALLGMLDVIADHPDGISHPSVVAIATSARRQIEAMIGLQRDDGHWPVIVTDATSGNEYSTMAFMVTGFQRAVRLGVIKPAVIRPSVQRATTALKTAFDGLAQLREVSAAVYASTVAEHYQHVPRGYVVPWGQGPALLAVWELIEKEDAT